MENPISVFDLRKRGRHRQIYGGIIGGVIAAVFICKLAAGQFPAGMFDLLRLAARYWTSNRAMGKLCQH